MKFRRGQAALEFLSTYGWAILIVLGSISALSYFNVFDTDQLAPNRCLINPAIACDIVFKPSQGEIELAIRNGIGFRMDNAQIAIDECTVGAGPVTVFPGTVQQLTVSGCTLERGQPVRKELNLTYINSNSNLQKIIPGTVQGAIPN